jgi:hypothetical protein
MLVNIATYSTASEDDRETGRIKVFDASVFVIAITFLILDTKAPRAVDLPMAARQAPQCLASADASNGYSFSNRSVCGEYEQ